jgi:transposase-like protein
MLKAGDMSRPALEIRLSTEEKETLLRWMRSSKAEQRMVQRARVILLAASGLNGKQIALKMQTRAARVSKWLRRFARDRIAALCDKHHIHPTVFYQWQRQFFENGTVALRVAGL